MNDNRILIELGSRIKGLLNLKNIKRSYMAEKLDITYNTLTKKLNGEREFTISEIFNMSEVFNMDTKTFLDILFREKFI